MGSQSIGDAIHVAPQLRLWHNVDEHRHPSLSLHFLDREDRGRRERRLSINGWLHILLAARDQKSR